MSGLAITYRTRQNSSNINVFYAIISYNAKTDKILVSFMPIVQKLVSDKTNMKNFQIF